MGGGKRRPINKSSSSKPTRRPPKQSLFIQGGILSGFHSPNPPSSSPSGGGSSSNPRSRNSNPKRSPPKSTFSYQYPSPPSQDHLLRSHIPQSASQPVILLGSRDTNIVAFQDPSPSTHSSSEVKYSYDYTSGFTLGDSSDTLLPSPDQIDINPAATELSSAFMDEDEPFHPGLGFSHQTEDPSVGVILSSTIIDNDEEEPCDDFQEDAEQEGSLDEQVPHKTPSTKKNSAFLSFGGMKLYTQDITDDETDDGDNEDEEEDCSDEGTSSGSSQSDDSEDTSDDDSDIDEAIMDDYLDGIGGKSQILKSRWLASQNLDGQLIGDDSNDDSSSDQFGDTLEKLSGFALQEASKEYGTPKQKLKKKAPSKSTKSKGPSADWSLDDLMLVKDPRSFSSKNKHAAQFPQSWPSRGRKSKKYGRFPGEKKKERKEMIAVKRRERMLRRGVDLEQINLKLKQMVLNKTDILSFQPMHSRDCSQVQRLAAIYRLKSGCQGSGKKRFITVSRTQQTSIPSASDAIRLEKLIGAGNDDADFSVIDTPQRSGSRSAPTQSRSFKTSANRQGSSSRNERRRSEKKPEAYANQPVTFVSSGVMESETLKTDAAESKVDATKDNIALDNSSVAVGSFEVHTKGFGSKMMAKMGFVEGSGLGKDGQGMSQPIEAIQRPKSLGLGMSFDESSSEPVKEAKREPAKAPKRNGGGTAKKPATPAVGAFEKHTKGFGSKMMMRMGFVEGTGLGRASQGIVTPLSAVRRPKARGLGAEDKRT